jgi:hypothetical protein
MLIVRIETNDANDGLQEATVTDALNETLGVLEQENLIHDWSYSVT